MATKKAMWVFFCILFVAASVLGSVAQVMAETWKVKLMYHKMKVERFPIPDAEGHAIAWLVSEGVKIYDNGEFGWHKCVSILDGINGVGPISIYGTDTFQDGSTMTTHSKGTSSGPTYQFTGEIIHGTGRFQGIKGTIMSTGKTLPLEKGEIAGRTVGEGTITFTLPPK